ncbi:unnamed protein product [Calypogeia fissa]
MIVEEERVTVMVESDEEDFTKINVMRVDPRVAARAQAGEHKQFWEDMGLGEFVSLDWTYQKGSMALCREFINNASGDATTVRGIKIDLSEDGLAQIFKLSTKPAGGASLRAR